jgi:hypothetical protein
MQKGDAVAQSAPAKARVRIDTERRLAISFPRSTAVSSSTWPLYPGGVFDEGSPLADANGFRRDANSCSLPKCWAPYLCANLGTGSWQHAQ